MKMEEYLNKVTEQMRCKKARASVAGELENHILDQMEANKQEGLNEEEALEKAIIEMGDPVEVGVSFDRIHRPQMSWGMLILAGVISVFSILLQLTFQAEGTDYVSYMAERQIFFIIFGYMCMCLVYYLDYTLLGKYATQIGGAFLVFMIISKLLFRNEINGSASYISIGTITFSIPLVMCLFIPVFGAILFQYRGEGYKAIVKAVMWMAVASCVLLGVSLPYAMFLGFSMLVVFVVAVWKEWFAVNRKVVLGVTASIIALVTIITIAFTGIALKLGILKMYQSDRIKAFLTKDSENYVANMAASILGKSSLVGGSKEAIELVKYNLPGANSELVFVSIVACFGILAGILVTGLMVFMIQKIFRISFGQKNQLGMIIGCGCGMVLFMLTFFSIGQSLGLITITAVILPFFSNSGSGTIVFYVLLGLVLSIYRYQNIPMTQKQKKRKKLKITFE